MMLLAFEKCIAIKGKPIPPRGVSPCSRSVREPQLGSMTRYTLNPALKFVPFVEVDGRPGTAADARDSGHRPAPASPLLSMGHISRPSRKLTVWIDGARVDLEMPPDQNRSQSLAMRDLSLALSWSMSGGETFG
jgi:hypothetical protein